MRRSVRVLVYNSQEACSASLRSELLSIEGLQIVAEVDELVLIEQAVRQFPSEIILINLDPEPDAVIPVARKIAEGNPGLAVFATSESNDGEYILAVMRAGVREFLPKPINRQHLTEAVQKVMSQVTKSLKLGKLISIIGTIGGSGASSLAVNLAVELSDLSPDHPVALVDMDFRYGQLATMMDLQSDYTLADLSQTPEQLDVAMIQKAMVKHSTGVHLLARPHHISQADQITAANCASVLGALQQMYRYVVVDGPVRSDPGGIAIFDMVDIGLIVLQLLVTSARNTHRILQGLAQEGYNLDRFKLICNRVSRESAHLELKHVEQTLNRKFFYQLPDDWKTIGSSINMGQPLKEYAPKARLRQSIRELAGMICDTNKVVAAEEEGRSGLLNTLFSAVKT